METGCIDLVIAHDCGKASSPRSRKKCPARVCPWLFGLSLLSLVPAAFGTDRPHIFGIGRANGGWTLLDPAGYSQSSYDAMAQAGAASTRLGASWADMEPNRGQYIWSGLDEEVPLCLARGITPYCLIVNTPAWASPTGQVEHGYPPRSESLPDFEAFCTQLAVRYAGRVDRWEVWNEQNGYGWHTDGGFNRVDEYAPVLRSAYLGLKAGNPNCLVAIGGLDDPDITPGDLTGWRGAYYMRRLYDELALRGSAGETLFDAVADHPYQSSQPLGDLRLKLRALNDQLAAHGDDAKPVWITEYGWSTKSGGVSRTRQAQLFVDYLSILLEPEFDYVTMACCLAISDMETGFEGWGLTDQNLRPKPAFWSFQGYPRCDGPQIARLDWRPVDASSVRVTWQTHLPATTQVEFGPDATYGSTTVIDSSLVTEHTACIGGLTPGVPYHVRALATAPGLSPTGSSDYTLRVEDLAVPNGDFEQGVPGIADGWRTVGKSFYTDGATVSRVHAGNHAQAIVTVGSWGQTLDDVMYTFVGVPFARPYVFSAVTRGETGLAGTQNRISRQVGTDPTGGTDPDAGTVVWSPERLTENEWQEQTVEAVAEARSVTVFVRGRALQYISGLHWLYVDDARFTALPTTYAAADFDRDGDIDQVDFGHFQACYSGSGIDPDPACTDAKLDMDADVDLDDFAVFQTCMSGPAVLATLNCMP
jgi:polysaccharide biosynthesis protein PslG